MNWVYPRNLTAPASYSSRSASLPQRHGELMNMIQPSVFRSGTAEGAKQSEAGQLHPVFDDIPI